MVWTQGMADLQKEQPKMSSESGNQYWNGSKIKRIGAFYKLCKFKKKIVFSSVNSMIWTKYTILGLIWKNWPVFLQRRNFLHTVFP